MKIKLELKQEQNIWFTSDLHLGHNNLCLGTTLWDKERAKDVVRNFNTLEDMNHTIIDNINNNVDYDDILLNLGDLSFGGFENIENFRRRIICQDFYTLISNHDHHLYNNKDNCQSLFTKVLPPYVELEIKLFAKKNTKKTNYKFILSHYPICSWNGMNKGVIHLHGHCHLPPYRKIGPGKMIDVGVDGNNFEPYSLNEIINLMDKKPIKSMFSFDHHITRLSDEE